VTGLLLLLLQADAIRVKSDGSIRIEIESAPPSEWKRETPLPGYTGTGYYTWRGGDLFGAPGRGVLRFAIRIGRGGTWHLRLRNRHDFEDATLENDCFTRMDDGPWIKTYSSERGAWTWSTNHETERAKAPAQYELEPGLHMLEISARSKNFSLDRIALYRDGAAAALDPSIPATPTLLEAMTGPEPYRKLGACVAKLRTGRGLGEARKAALARRESSDPEESREAERLATQLTRYAEGLFREAGELPPAARVRALEEIASLYAGDEPAHRARTDQETLRRDPGVQSELKADAIWLPIQEGLRRLRPFAGSRDPRSPGFRRLNAAAIEELLDQAGALARRYPETAAARKAEGLIRSFR
jgi:hypothetical protein